MNSEIIIRPYVKDDAVQLIELMKLNVPSFFDERELADFKYYLENELELYFVAELHNQLIGSGGINFNYPEKIGIISWDIIHPNFQRMGIGSSLLHHRLNILQSTIEIESIQVRTSQMTYKFYEKCGFNLEKIVPDYWAKGYDLYSMKFVRP